MHFDLPFFLSGIHGFQLLGRQILQHDFLCQRCDHRIHRCACCFFCHQFRNPSHFGDFPFQRKLQSSVHVQHALMPFSGDAQSLQCSSHEFGTVPPNTQMSQTSVLGNKVVTRRVKNSLSFLSLLFHIIQFLSLSARWDAVTVGIVSRNPGCPPCPPRRLWLTFAEHERRKSTGGI